MAFKFLSKNKSKQMQEDVRREKEAEKQKQWLSLRSEVFYAAFMDENTNKDLTFAEQVRRHFRPVSAQEAAQGSPLQEAAPSEKSYKRTQRRKKLGAYAKSQTPVGDYTSYQIVTQMQDISTQKDNSIHYFSRVIRGWGNYSEKDLLASRDRLKPFLKGYQAKPDGKPINKEEKEKQYYDMALLSRQLQMDLARDDPAVKSQPESYMFLGYKTPQEDILNIMVNEVLPIHFTASMFTDSYLSKHAGEVSRQIDQVTGLEREMLKDENEDYFSSMEAGKKEILDNLIDNFDGIVRYFDVQLRSKGVDIETGDYIRNGDYEVSKEEREDVQKQFWDAISASATVGDKLWAAVNRINKKAEEKQKNEQRLQEEAQKRRNVVDKIALNDNGGSGEAVDWLSSPYDNGDDWLSSL